MDMFDNGPMTADSAPETEGMFPSKISLAMSYVPYQRFENLYDGEKALTRGTLFACLDLPFHSGKERVK